jgi:hypothetical protein
VSSRWAAAFGPALAEDITMEFSQFYQEGGIFMHVVTLLSLVTGARLLRRAGGIRRTFRDPAAERSRLRWGDPLTPALVATVVLAGMLGTVSGFGEVHAALLTVPPEVYAMAQSRGSQIALYPLSYALMLAIPLTLGHGLLAYFEARLRGLIDEQAA